MKHLLYIIVFLVTIIGNAQSIADSSVIPNDNLIGFAFGKAARQSISVQLVGDLLRSRKYDSLKLLMHSQNSALMYLSIRACEFEEKRNRLIFSPEDKKIIESAKESEQQIEYRSGCTIREMLCIKELFNRDNYIINKQMNWWLREMVRLQK